MILAFVRKLDSKRRNFETGRKIYKFNILEYEARVEFRKF